MAKAHKFLQIGILLVSFVSPAVAWEPDVHYGLVKWLAVQAGFALDGAELIAAGSESADETHVLAAIYLVGEVCVRRKGPNTVAVSRVVQQHHFAAAGPVPNSPHNRPVIPGRHGDDNFGNQWVRQEIQTQATTKSPVVQLNRFGAALHPLADSWSHAGVPDVPRKLFLKCRQPTLAWAHPKDRGGWSSHNADLTYMHKVDTLETAESVYLFMLEFLKANPLFQARPSVKWGALEGRVVSFQERKTRATKFEWFMEESESVSGGRESLPYDAFSTHPCFLKHLSLKKGKRKTDFGKFRCAKPKAMAADAPPASHQRAVVSHLTAEPDSLLGFVDGLLHAWIINQDFGLVVNDSVSLQGFESNANFSAMASSGLSAEESVESLLKMWLVEDHGLVNSMGHGVTNPELLQRLSALGPDTNDADWALISADQLSDAISYPSSPVPFSVFPDESGEGSPESYTVLFSLENAPRDLVSLSIEKVDDSWKLVGMGWTTN